MLAKAPHAPPRGFKPGGLLRATFPVQKIAQISANTMTKSSNSVKVTLPTAKASGADA
jgi:hypothetical protein